MGHKTKKQKVTFGYAALVGIVFLAGDAVLAFLFAALGISLYLLLILGFVEAIGFVAALLKATWNALPKGVQKELRKL